VGPSGVSFLARLLVSPVTAGSLAEFCHFDTARSVSFRGRRDLRGAQSRYVERPRANISGKNAVHLLHPIFGLGRDDNAGKSPYQIAVSEARRREGSDVDSSAIAYDGAEDGSASRRTRSLRRKDSVKRRLEGGGSLSNAHSNTWPHDDRSEEETEEMMRDRALHRAEAWGQRQTTRRQAVQDRIERGRALSDSTGGHWSDKG
jgi:hypothetical protein